MKPRDVDKNTPIWILQQLWGKARSLEASIKDTTITIRRTSMTEVVVKERTVVLGTYNVDDKDQRRILLHRIWRWQQKTKWRIK